MQHNYVHQLAEVSEKIESIASVVPAQRAAFRQGFSFSALSFEEQLPVWDYIWHHGSWRAQLHAYFFLERFVSRRQYAAVIGRTSADWQEKVADWGLCDALAKINTKALEVLPTEVYAQLTAWNISPNQWKRRQSVVSLLYFSRTKKVYLPFADIAALIAPLLPDKEYYVQKGVGWALREMHTVYSTESMLFIDRHIHDISSIAFTIAIEKMNEQEKGKLKEKRKRKSKMYV